MQEEIEQKSVSFTFQAGKLTARGLQKVIAFGMRKMAQARRDPHVGRNSLKKIAGRDGNYEYVDVGSSLPDFERIARKNRVRYSVERDASANLPRWRICFRANQASALDKTFKEYTALTLGRKDRPSLREQLRKLLEVVRNTPAKERSHDHGAHER